MAKRMTRMEACHHLTLLREMLERDLDRMREQVKTLHDGDQKRYYLRTIAADEAKIRAIDMAGAALTR